MIRVSAYVDGFNLYHAIANLNDNRLKWLDLKALVQIFIDPKIHQLVSVSYFSAFATWKQSAYGRHILYERALSTTGVKTVMGHFKEKDKSCPKCRHRWKGHEEKETDVNIALSLLDDAYQDIYDIALIISQDSDLFPAIKLVRTRFPNKTIKIITPPNMRHSKEMGAVVGRENLKSILPLHLARCLLPQQLTDTTGKTILIPQEYARS
jgi:uncharacterized LabA/DUF88 family protein